MPLTKIQLDLMAAHGCETPGCNHEGHDTVFLHGRCHPRARAEASYECGSGVLRVACADCHKLIAEIKVAE
jgi:hypothetical protein